MEDLTTGLEGYDVVEPAIPVRQVNSQRAQGADLTIATDLSDSFDDNLPSPNRGDTALDDTLDLSASFGALEDLNLAAVCPPASTCGAAPANAGVQQDEHDAMESTAPRGLAHPGTRADGFVVDAGDFLEESIDSLPDTSSPPSLGRLGDAAPAPKGESITSHKVLSTTPAVAEVRAGTRPHSPPAMGEAEGQLGSTLHQAMKRQVGYTHL